ncbi:MAG: transglycosylase SLT domain-containing protein [Oligoflexales bacterium]|nr:transglycosylase SLT domain-containing protein [Oligoflexales bacterium]
MKRLVPLSLISILISVFCQSGQAVAKTKASKKHPCFNGRNKTCEIISHLKPSMNLNEALKLSNSFYRVARKHCLDPKLLVSIAFQESCLQLDVVRKTNGYILVDDEYVEASVGSDFCMMQVNIRNIKHYNLDVNKLLTEPDYCINAGAIILKDIENRYSRKEHKWWSRYNSVSRFHREIYQKHIERHMEKIPDQYEEDVTENSEANSANTQVSLNP